jgi:hypothetical protein
MNIEFNEAMNEISGFGGYYERCCRRAVVAGATWCAAHPHLFDAEQVESAIRKSEMITDDGRKVLLGDELTGTQLAVAMYHIRFIAQQGWNQYAQAMSAPMVVYSDETAGKEHEHAE